LQAVNEETQRSAYISQSGNISPQGKAGVPQKHARYVNLLLNVNYKNDAMEMLTEEVIKLTVNPASWNPRSRFLVTICENGSEDQYSMVLRIFLDLFNSFNIFDVSFLIPNYKPTQLPKSLNV
jgi:hypothetical protein